jgi:hypothetical protein
MSDRPLTGGPAASVTDVMRAVGTSSIGEVIGNHPHDEDRHDDDTQNHTDPVIDAFQPAHSTGGLGMFRRLTHGRLLPSSAGGAVEGFACSEVCGRGDHADAPTARVVEQWKVDRIVEPSPLSNVECSNAPNVCEADILAAEGFEPPTR